MINMVLLLKQIVKIDPKGQSDQQLLFPHKNDQAELITI